MLNVAEFAKMLVILILTQLAKCKMKFRKMQYVVLEVYMLKISFCLGGRHVLNSEKSEMQQF